MSEFRYTARNAEGKTVKGVISADHIGNFYAALRGQKLYCLSYQEETAVQRAQRRRHKMKIRELIVFCRKLGTMMGSGLSMTSALEMLYSTAETPELKDLYIAVYENIQRGMSLSQAMRIEGNSFPPFLINMIESGESSGNLDSILTTLAGHYENENKLMHKIKSATIYPTILLVVSVGVVILLFTFVLPRMMTMFQNAEVPPITKAVMALSDFLVAYWPFILAVFVGLILLFANARHIPKLQYALDRMKLHTPIFGKMNRITYSSRFARSMSILYASGIPLITALRLSSNVLGNLYVDHLFTQLMQDVSMGESLSAAIERAGIFDKLLPSMIRVGEETGNLDQVLASISDYYDTEAENAINRMISILEPVMLVVLAVIITIVLAAVMLPIYSMYSSLL